MNEQVKLLIVDDEDEIRNMINRYFSREGFCVYSARNGDEMRRVLQKEDISLILLDVRLPGEDGLSLAREIRKTSNTPIIMLTAKSDVIDRVAGLESGADDYLPKPFELRELLARSNAVLRRTLSNRNQIEQQQFLLYKFNDWSLNTATRQLCSPDGSEVLLSPAEFDLLVILLCYPNRVLDREFLLDLSRGRAATPFDRTIDVRIAQIRKKLETTAQNYQLIKTIRNAGYMFCCDVQSSVAET